MIAAPAFDIINEALFDLIPKDQFQMVMEHNYFAQAEIGPDFLGFVNLYWHLADMIPKHWTVVDLGCAYAPQAWLFKDHKAYIGVDLMRGTRFAAPNTSHFVMPITKYLADHAGDLNRDETFAICSYCPMWGDRSTKPIRDCFSNLFIYYPHGGTHERHQTLRSSTVAESRRHSSPAHEPRRDGSQVERTLVGLAGPSNRGSMDADLYGVLCRLGNRTVGVDALTCTA